MLNKCQLVEKEKVVVGSSDSGDAVSYTVPFFVVAWMIRTSWNKAKDLALQLIGRH